MTRSTLTAIALIDDDLTLTAFKRGEIVVAKALAETADAVLLLSSGLDVMDGALISSITAEPNYATAKSVAFNLKRDKGLLAKIVGQYTFAGAIDVPNGATVVTLELDFTERGAFGGVGLIDTTTTAKAAKAVSAAKSDTTTATAKVGTTKAATATDVRPEDKALLKALRMTKGPATLKVLATKMGVTTQQAWHSLNRLKAAGLVTWTVGESGSYRAA